MLATRTLLCLLFLFSVSNGAELVIYSVDSLFLYPVYNFTQAFEQFAGLPEGSVQHVRVSDGRLEDVITQPTNPTPDVVIGIDNIHQYGISPNTFLLVNSTEAQFINTHLAARLAPYNLFPYEYGRVTLIGNTTRIGSKFDPSTLTLQNLVSNPDILRTLIVQDPNTSVTGAAFLLASIATFGDPKIGLQGVINGSSWQDWWRTVLQYSTVISSWSDSLELFDKNETFNLMISYELDPTYYFCNEGTNDIVALQLQNDLWYYIAGIGVFNSTKNVTLATQFVNWFLSEPLQSLLPNHEWMFPARNNVELPACFKGYVPPTPEFNEHINVTTLQQNLYKWYAEWEQIKNSAASSTSSSSSTSTSTSATSSTSSSPTSSTSATPAPSTSTSNVLLPSVFGLSLLLTILV